MSLRLTARQLEAVTHGDGPLLVLAGAGSGKTSVLAARAAHITKNLSVSPSEILAFTFTRKAAREMKDRIASLIGLGMNEMWVGTFHSIGLRILRANSAKIGIAPNFLVYDRKDSHSVIREVLTALGLSEKVYTPREVQDKISSAKNVLIMPDEYLKIASTEYEKDIAAIYREYDRILRKRNALDFDDILLASVSALDKFPEIKDGLARRFKHVLVDEYQDTNVIQFEMIRKLASVHGNVCVVGDDDQSIFGWRGAELGNILSFEEKFPGTKVVRLEENFRSTAKIVQAAKEVIENNRRRKGKSLWTKNVEGESISMFIVDDEETEAECIAEKAREERLRRSGYGDIAVLYRTNAQSRAIENALFKHRIPYEIVAGVSFYERKEVKDLLSYLRIVSNSLDDVSLVRVMNVPPRGIGKTTVDKLKKHAAMNHISLMDAVRKIRAIEDISEKTKRALESFAGLIDGIAEKGAGSVHEVLKTIVDKTKYLEYVDGEGEDKVENAEELMRAAAKWDMENQDGDLSLFLQELSIMSDVDSLDEETDRVKLMTVHAAKGLEFPVVFIPGVEEGIFPHASALNEKQELEEERRLFHVALTRAKEKVYILSAAGRKWSKSEGVISRFAREIPKDILWVVDAVGLGGRRRY